MKISRERLLGEARQTGFRPEILEKVFHLLTLLRGFEEHPFLRGRLALKGGSALNLFYDHLPRLSVDIDLNYIGAPDREEMMAERPQVEQAITAVCQREGMQVRRVPPDHAGGKWHLRYESAWGTGGNLEVDLNFMFRVPLWPAQTMPSRHVGTMRADAVQVVDIHELAAGKLAALLSRHASRDLFDAHRLLRGGQLEKEKLRFAFVVYGAMNRKDWRSVTPDVVRFDEREIEDALIPVLATGDLERMSSTKSWAKRMVEDCQELLEIVLPLAPQEREFLDEILDRGQIVPALLTADSAFAQRLMSHPGLQWKAMNVRRQTKRT